MTDLTVTPHMARTIQRLFPASRLGSLSVPVLRDVLGAEADGMGASELADALESSRLVSGFSANTPGENSHTVRFNRQALAELAGDAKTTSLAP